MKFLAFGLSAFATLSTARHGAHKQDEERVQFDIYERIGFYIFERVRFSILADPPWTLNITIGIQRQHIGSWWGPQHLGVETKDWLNKACKQTDKWGSEKCSSEAWTGNIEIDIKDQA